ncbi:DEAD/DEAH box helicase [Microbacterium sp. SORGH_AS_0888]|uniref:DEAD/DEAH box helicase n=1 Tax=Microbacterium sp. SORGH_AS_0888 TaxID=3041791 RepID=UPI0027D87C0E|nr:DEAD/DEAH box helicase [Microbacterium sp. SORGH_AS_0888]
MPKNKKPAGGRPAKNFEPRYGSKTSYQDRKRRPGEASAGTAGSKSPNHRGYRAADAERAGAPKQRWTSQERAGREEARSIRSQARGDERPRRAFDERPARARDDRPARSFDREERPRRSFEDRPARSSGREDRPARSFDDRPRRSFDERPARSHDRGERGTRPPQDRPARSFDRAERPSRSFGDRPSRPSPRDERPRRDDRRNDRPNRSDWNAAPQRTAAAEQHVDVVHERLQAEAVDANAVTEASFAELGLGDNIVRALAELGAASPFPIQTATIAPIIEGRDVLARGRTGSGKTIAFGAPLVERVLRSKAGVKREFGRAPVALILAPTRELALQIDRTVQPIARSVGLFTTQIYGGVPQARQVGALKKGVDIIIGTPGRIEDLQNQGKLDLSQVGVVVLDEADHMSELGFLEPMQRILRLVADGAQKLLFSATLDREVAALVDEFLVDPAVYEVAGEDQDSGTIDHRVLVIDHRDKAEILTSLVDREGKTLVFARTRAYAEMLAEQFDDAGIPAVALHGDLNQAKRTRNLQRLTDGRVSVLVATDVAARGIHVDDIDLVVQADAPDEYKTYLHRSGRTGRAGRSGTVVSLIARQRRRRMTELLQRAEIEAPFDEVRPGDDLLEEIAGRQVDPVS